jgi:hypothetical protein
VSQTEAMIARMRAKCIARYRLKGVPGHPEDLVQIGSEQTGISIVYGCYAIRVRLHHGREWLAHADFDPAAGLDQAVVGRLHQILDPHFGWTPRGYPIIGPDGPVDPQLAALYRPPIGGLIRNATI